MSLIIRQVFRNKVNFSSEISDIIISKIPGTKEAELCKSKIIGKE